MAQATLSDEDRAALRRALALAEGGRGRVSPNPLVGAVLVRAGRTIGVHLSPSPGCFVGSCHRAGIIGARGLL